MTEQEVFGEVRTGDFERLVAYAKSGPLGIVDRDGLTLLHQAISIPATLPMAVWLAQSGVNINAQDRCGLTPLHFAALYGMPEVAKTLLQHGANVAFADEHGNQPLWTAVVNATHGNLDLVESTSRGPRRPDARKQVRKIAVQLCQEWP